MRFKCLAFFAALMMVFALSYSANAQTLSTDLVFVKVGYIPVYTVDYKAEGIKDAEQSGFAVQGEYNLNFGTFWLGVGLEYERVKTEDFTDDEDVCSQFIMPMVSAKLAAMGGLYLGVGLSGKYLVAADDLGEVSPGVKMEFTKEFDLWANAIVGFYMPIGEAVFLDLEGRFGYNLTNNQYSEVDVDGVTAEYDVNSTYDFAVYVGIGFRAAMSDY